MKIKRILIVLLVLWMFAGCTPRTSPVTSEEWIDSTINIINNHLSDTSKSIRLIKNTSDGDKEIYQMKMKEREWITVEFLSTESEENGQIRYLVTYNYPPTKDPDYDTVLYIVNTIAKKPYSKDFCEDLINSPEEDYSIERKGSLKSRNYLVAKYREQSFFDVGTLEYYQYSQYAFEHNEGDQTLVFSGLPAF